MGQNIRLEGSHLFHLGKVGFHSGKGVCVKIIVDAVPQVLRTEVDLVILAGVLAV